MFLLPGLPAGPAYLSATQSRRGPLALARLLHDHGGVHQIPVGLGAEDGVVQLDGADPLLIQIQHVECRHAQPFFDFLITTSPPVAPGMAPLMNRRFSSGRASTTAKRCTVTRSLPICPGRALFFQTRDGCELLPMDPGAR